MDFIELEKRYFIGTYSRIPIMIDHGEGVYLFDTSGKKYLDLLAGIAVMALGYGHPEVVNAIAEQAKKYIHLSNLYYMKPQLELSEKLISYIGEGYKIFFANSGSEANEGAIKLARKYFRKKGMDKKYKVIGFEDSFHGRTIATLAATWQEKYQKDYIPLMPAFKKAKFNDLSSLESLIDEEVAAIIVEPIQGEGGIKNADEKFLKGLRDICDKYDIILITDEIQSGMGRTGKFLAQSYAGIKGDIITLAKALGGGLPISAFVASPKIVDAFSYGDHGTTFGGNPVAAAASIATLDVIEKESLIEKNTEKGELIIKGIEILKEKYPKIIKDVRGKGLMIGIELFNECNDMVGAFREKGILLNCTHGNVVRLLPPYIIEKEHIDMFLNTFEDILKNS